MKWITALNLQQWAATISARTVFPALVGDLIRASASDIAAFRFPSGDKGQVRGFDGFLEAPGASTFVPAGQSIWEFGLQPNIQEKFEGDLEKRDALDSKKRVVTTFVFVSAYTWDKPKKPLPEYIAEQKLLHQWKDIILIDGPQLETWLAECPAVAARYARVEMNLAPQAGARSTDEFWDEYSHRYSPQLTEDVPLSGREKQATDLVKDLLAGPSGIRLAADSPDEVIAFAIAAIRKADPAVRLFLESRALVLDTAEAARQLRRDNRVYLPRAQATPVSGQLTALAPTVLAIGRDQPNGEHTLLLRPSPYVLAKSIETMGFSADKALELARRSGRSITILERQIPGGNAVNPPWLTSVQKIMPAILAGGWEATREADLKALTMLADGVDYDSLERTCREHAALQDPPMDLEGSVWKIRAPVDAFIHAGRHITKADLERLAAVCKAVFSQRVEPPADDEPFGGLSTPDGQPYSSWLRDGLATTLLQLAVFPDQAAVNVRDVKPQEWVNALVADLPGLREDPRLIASLREELPLLAEAAPDPLLSALEHLLEGNEFVKALFWKRDGLFGPSSPHVYLLWALERLAWDPRRLQRVALLIAKLASITQSHTASGNSPMRTLRSIFLAWNPNTYAGFTERVRIVEGIVDKYPDVGWELIAALLPQSHATNVPTSKPRFRDVEPQHPEVLTRRIVRLGYDEAIKRALQLSVNSVERLMLLVDTMHNWSDSDIEKLLVIVEQFLSQTRDLRVWNKLRDVASHHKSFEQADWSLDDKWLRRIDEIVRRFGPTDVIDRHTWLFDKFWVEVPGPYLEREKLTADARTAAIREIGNSSDQIFKLIESVKTPETVAYGVIGAFPNIVTIEEYFRTALERRSENATRFAEALSSSALRSFPSQWLERVRAIFEKTHVASDVMARMIVRWPDNPDTWNFALSLGSEVDASYWRLKPGFQFDGSDGDLLYGVERFLAAKRPSAALAFSHTKFGSLKRSVLFQMLYDLIGEVNGADGEDNNLTIYLAKDAIAHLGKRPGVELHDLARLEYAYLPVLRDRETPLNIDKLLASDPVFYVELIASVFRADDEAAGPEEITEPMRAKWRADYSLLSDFHLVPGSDGATVEHSLLDAWVGAVRSLAREQKRLDIADQYVGHLLAYSPGGPEGIWPHPSVSQVIENVGSSHLEEGFRIECHNKRGVYSKEVFEGGGQERALARKYQEWASRASEFPRVGSLLQAIAADWEIRAEREDVRARQDMMRE